jgi:hypothetical protein
MGTISEIEMLVLLKVALPVKWISLSSDIQQPAVVWQAAVSLISKAM